MIHSRKRRIYFLLLLLFGTSLAIALVLYALRQNIDLFYTPSELLAEIPSNRVRLGGMVRQGSIIHNAGLQIAFVVTDFNHEVPVEYNGVLPDLFREGQGVVALGSYSAGKFIAEQILAKHDENYMPPGYK